MKIWIFLMFIIGILVGMSVMRVVWMIKDKSISTQGTLYIFHDEEDGKDYVQAGFNEQMVALKQHKYVLFDIRVENLSHSEETL